MQGDVKLDKIFNRMEANWKNVLERNNDTSYTIELDSFKREDGEFLEVKLQQASADIISVFRKHDPNVDHGLFAAGYIVAVTRDFFGNPFFYADVDEAGNEIPVDEKLETMESSKMKIAQFNDADELISVANGMLQKLQDNSQKVSPENVKTPSDEENQT